MFQELSLTTQTLYAELLDQVLALGVAEPMSRTGGSFIRKTIKRNRMSTFSSVSWVRAIGKSLSARIMTVPRQ